MLDPHRIDSHVQPHVGESDTGSDSVTKSGKAAGYTPDELRSNRNWIQLVTAALLVANWTAVVAGAMPMSGAIAITVIVLVCAAALWSAFGTRTAVKIDESSTGMGKDVDPKAMGGVLGYLNDGFTE